MCNTAFQQFFSPSFGGSVLVEKIDAISDAAMLISALAFISPVVTCLYRVNELVFLEFGQICGVSLSLFLTQLGKALLRNETTLESSSTPFCGTNDGRHSAAALGNIHYDLGSAWANFQSVFGPNPLLWLVPVPSTYGDGSFQGVRHQVNSTLCRRKKQTDTFQK
ncbi:unnamed protein product [Gongylonema pulchrum]|uniref:Pecanex-like protein n=1 Tax=Gongylonema pulchrum TaxID=637853 RepID=A0A183DB26_9BILA|nr:unnamed protein product [Gongylonema pulchrum]